MPAASLMRRDQEFGAKQRGRPRVLDQIIVPADQDAGPNSPRCIEDREGIAAGNEAMLPGMQLAMAMNGAIRHADRVAVIELSVFTQLQEARADRDALLTRERGYPADRRTGERLRQRPQRRAIEFRNMPISADAHLGKDDKLIAGLHGFFREMLHAREIKGLVIGPMLKLHG